MQAISVATWNVNSIRMRLPAVLAWLAEAKPDIALLQETKTQDDGFPLAAIEEQGYNVAIAGQKSYNGVAIFSRFPLDDIRRDLPGSPCAEEMRYIEAVASLPGTALRVASVYVPNGQDTGSDKWPRKLAFLEALRAHAAGLLTYGEMLVLGGDYNLAPAPDDVYDPAALDGTVCYHPEERARGRALLHLGLYDAFRLRHPSDPGFTWWDYRENRFPRNQGLRIDHLLLSPEAADRAVECEVHASVRGGEKPSDHAPVMVHLQVA